jgi:hypothetical protein
MITGAQRLFLLAELGRSFPHSFQKGTLTMARLNCICGAELVGVGLLASLLAAEAGAQLVWQQAMDKYSAILPLTLDNSVYRIRAKPPEGIRPQEVNCDIGITGTVLTDQRGTSANEPGEKVVSGLLELDDIDVQFTDRVFTGYHNIVGDRIIRKYDFDCGINVKYENKKKVAQVELRVGYVLPSGDIEGLTWAKLRRKQRIFAQNIRKCDQCIRDIHELEAEARHWQTAGGNNVQRTLVQARLAGINRKIQTKQRFASRKEEYARDLAAFASITEYLKTKVNGCQIYVHFHYNGDTLPVDIDELKRSRVRPIQVFEYHKDPIRKRAELAEAKAAG